MAKYFIIGETGSDELWLVDVDKRSAEPLTQAVKCRPTLIYSDYQ